MSEVLEDLTHTDLREYLWSRGDLRYKLWDQQKVIYDTIRAGNLQGTEIVLLCSRQFGKCVRLQELVATPRGPVAIKDLTLGQEIYGYNPDGTVGITRVVAKEFTGRKKLLRLGRRGREVCAVTPEHRFLARWRNHKHDNLREEVLTAEDLVVQRRKKFARVFIDAPLGDVDVPDAYAVGAMIGNGCKYDGYHLKVSSATSAVPEHMARILGCYCLKVLGHNHTWNLSSRSSQDKKHSEIIKTSCDEWFRGLYSHDKYIDRSLVSKWNRESCLKLLAGLTDTDGSVVLQTDGTLRWAYSTGSRRLAEDVQWLVYWLFGKKPGLTEHFRRGSLEYTIHVICNLNVRRMLRQISPFMVEDHKRYRPEYENLSNYNAKEEYIGLQVLEEYEDETCDIQVDNETNLFVLHSEGLITHNSHLGVLLAVEDCLRFPERCILIVGPTIQQVREIVAPRIRKIAQDAPPGLVNRTKSENKWYIGQSELVLGGFDQSASAQRGKTVQNIYVEEIVDSHPDDYIEAMRSDLGPALTHSDSGKLVFLTTPPKIPDHPFIQDTMVKAQLHNTFFKFTIDDNVQLSERQYQDCVERAGGKNTIDFRREYLCEIVRDPTKIVVPGFDKEKHVCTFPLPTKYNMHVTIDWGGVRDKTVALLHCYDYASDLDLILDERVFDANTATSEIIAELRGMEGEEAVTRFADVPGQLLVDLNSGGYITNAPIKDDWKAGINQMNVRFSTDKVKISPRCQFLIMSLESGTFNKTKTDFERTSALGHCDALAALMYGLRSRSGSNPYGAPIRAYNHPSQFIVPRETDAPLAKAVSPKNFGFSKSKRFGSFK